MIFQASARLLDDSDGIVTCLVRLAQYVFVSFGLALLWVQLAKVLASVYFWKEFGVRAPGD